MRVFGIIRRRGPRTDRDPALNPTRLLFGALVVGLGLLVLLISMRAQSQVPGRSYYTVNVQFEGAFSLPSPRSDVRIAGRRVGQTVSGELDRGVATVELQLDGDIDRLPVDSTARLRPRGLLGAQFVDLVPGESERTLPSGSFIAAERTSSATNLSEVLDALDRRRRAALGRTIRGLGGGLAGRGGRVNEALQTMPRGLRDLRSALRPLLDRRGVMTALIRGSESFAGALDPVRDDLAAGFADTEAAIRPFARERDSVAELLDLAPGALEGTRAALARTDPLLVRTERFANAATAYTASAPRALDSLTTLLTEGRDPLADAAPVLRIARSAVPPTLRLTGALDPALPRLRQTLQLARRPSRVLGRYSCDIERWARTWRSWLGYAPRGHVGRLGPLTMARLTLVSGATVPGTPSSTPGSRVAGDVAPCEPDRGPAG